jgi:hypothetical protein
MCLRPVKPAYRHSSFGLLPRPDGYVAMVAEKGDWKAIGLYLDGLRLTDARLGA